MTLRLPFVEAHPSVQQALDQITKQFPLNSGSLQTGIVLQLASTGTARKAAFGSVTLTWPGGAQGSGAQTITHGLGATPQIVVATCLSAAGAGLPAALVTATGSTTFSLMASSTSGSPSAGFTATAYWLAIG